MRVLSLSTALNNGGAAKVAQCLSQGLASYCDLVHVTQEDLAKASILPWGRNLKRSYYSIRRKVGRLATLVDRHEPGIYKSYGMMPTRMSSLIRRVNPDLVLLHWVQGEFLSIKDIGSIDVPIVWVMHDCWPFSASEHHQLVDSCSYVRGYRERKPWSPSKLVYNAKQKYFKDADITLVGPSPWICAKSRSSLLMGKRKIENIPNPLDLNIFNIQLERSKAREMLQIDANSHVALVGSLTESSDPVKGLDILHQALEVYSRYGKQLILVVLGTSSFPSISGVEMRQVGTIANESDMSIYYSASDMTLIPSRVETHSQMAAESIACGTPVVAFNVGGNSSIVEHEISGFLAKPFSPADFARGMKEVLDQEVKISRRSVSRDSKKWDMEQVSSTYYELFRSLTGKD